ncbi:hypothetical protein [Actinokineospora pegani]|uniref:hypothetical protein n=1 Tax=Actinokineospora pegani TaxID=2654637 RepID=UPI0012EA4D22|nr:hypothetical protein [Actinokineospora pegani]
MGEKSAETESTRSVKVSRYTRWILPVVLVVELALLPSGVISFSDGILIIVIIEATFALLVIAELFTLRRAVRRARARGQTLFDAVLASLDHILPPWGARLIRHDLIMWRAIWLVVRGRRDIPPGGDGIDYSAQLRPRFWVFFFIFPIEIVAVELILPWPVVRIVMTVLGSIGLVWYLALIATLYKYPHTIDSNTLRLRWSSFNDHSVPVAQIESVRLAKKQWPVKRSVEAVDGVLVMEMEQETNVRAQLREPYRVDLGKHGTEDVTAVAFWADDAPGAVAKIAQRLDR